ncbi:MAG TPA: hypothetical protein PKH31_06560 [Candidatus Sumerlaeota bacterium]|nr:hypothetical protein [Candidatus Sumerlaeota bacterium]
MNRGWWGAVLAGGLLAISSWTPAAQPAAPKAETGKTAKVAEDGKMKVAVSKVAPDAGKKGESAALKPVADDKATSASQPTPVALPPVWGRDWKAARAQSESEKRPMLAVFGISAFETGQNLITGVLAQPEVIETLKNDYVLVYLDAPDVPALMREFHVTSFPVAILTHADGTELGRFMGVRSARPADFLERVANARKTGEELRVLNAAIEAAPGDMTLLKQKGALLMAQGDMSNAIAAYRQAFLADSQNVQDIPESVLTVLKAEQKVRNLKDRIHQEPKNAALYRELGTYMVEYERPEEAYAAFEQALRLDPTVKEGIPDVYSREIETKLEWEKQMKEVEEQLAKVPEDVTLLRRRGDLLAGNGLSREVEQMARALADYRKVMQLAPDKGADLAADVAFLEIVTKQDRPPQAMVDDLVAFEKAYPKSRRVEMALYIRALALFQAESVQEGEQVLREYQKRYPTGAMAQEVKAMLEDLTPASKEKKSAGEKPQGKKADAKKPTGAAKPEAGKKP